MISSRIRVHINYAKIRNTPCYVFVRSDAQKYFQVVTGGIVFMLTMVGRPAPIPNKESDAIRRTVVSHLEIEPHPFLCCGDWVRVKSGPLCDVEGILVRRKGAPIGSCYPRSCLRSLLRSRWTLSLSSLFSVAEITAVRLIKQATRFSNQVTFLDHSAL